VRRDAATDVNARQTEPTPVDDVRAPDEPETETETERDSGDEPPVNPDRARHCFAHLVPGTIVLRAEMVLAYGDAFFKRIAVLPPPPALTPDVSGTR
jgi:hypothetical protein